jgi:DNA-binding transcriptional regulator of glucitol operon
VGVTHCDAGHLGPGASVGPVRSFFRSRGFSTVAVSVIALIGGCLLAYWQWTRYQSASGTLQNLGYVLQWPLFGVFPGFMFYKIYRAAQREKAADAEIAAGPTVPEPRVGEPATAGSATEITPEFASRWAYVQNRKDASRTDGDADLHAYNDYLANLNAREERRAG